MSEDEILVVKSRIYERMDEYNLGSDLHQELSDKLGEILDEAAERAEANGRKTIQARDV